MRTTAALIATALLAAGCGAGAATTTTATTTATATSTPESSPSVVARAQRTHEVPTPPGRQTTLGGWRSPVQAVQVFAETYINWSASTVSTHLRALAEVSLGQARAAMLLESAQTRADSELQRSAVANSGTVEAIAPLAGHDNQYVVVTREQTTSATRSAAYAGLPAGWHVSIATVTRIPGRLWVLSAWQPES